MKKLVLIILVMTCLGARASEERSHFDSLEDTIVTKDGKEIFGKVKAIGEADISYQDYKKEKPRLISIRNVKYIKYDDGRVVDYSDAIVERQNARLNRNGALENIVLITLGIIVGGIAIWGLVSLIQFLLWLS